LYCDGSCGKGSKVSASDDEARDGNSHSNMYTFDHFEQLAFKKQPVSFPALAREIPPSGGIANLNRLDI
jgi:hypothetical protein